MVRPGANSGRHYITQCEVAVCKLQVPLGLENENNKSWKVVQKLPRKCGLYKLFSGMGRILKSKQSRCYSRVETK